MKEQSPIGRIWELGEREHGRLICAVILAVIGVACGMVPYFAAAKIIVLLLAKETAFTAYLPWLLAALGGFLLRTVLYNGALGISHKATFQILKTIRQKLPAKLPRLPLGTVMDASSSKLKETIVAQVDSTETTLAHLFPEMTANIVTPVPTVVYLFLPDWRPALLSLVVFPIAFVFMMMVMGNYGKDYEGAVRATTEMSGTMIEYINGIEVIKAFNQGKASYTKLIDKVRANAQYYYDWMRRSQLGMSMAYAFFPAQMLTILPFGWLFYTHGTLTVEAFVTVIILALGMAAPIVAAFNFVDTLAQVGTTVAQVDEILKAEEQAHGTQRVAFADRSIEVKEVSFGYHDDTEILHDVSLRIPQNSMTALVGPSGSGKSTLAKLIAGFWDVKHGTITMGGHDLKEIPLEQLYDQVEGIGEDVCRALGSGIQLAQRDDLAGVLRCVFIGELFCINFICVHGFFLLHLMVLSYRKEKPKGTTQTAPCVGFSGRKEDYSPAAYTKADMDRPLHQNQSADTSEIPCGGKARPPADSVR